MMPSLHPEKAELAWSLILLLRHPATPASTLPSSSTMSRRRRQGLEDVEPRNDDHIKAKHDESMDDALIRELEEERQKLLAASAADGAAHDSDQDEEEDANPDRIPEGDDDEEDSDAGLPLDEDDSEDEWQPPQPPSKPTRQGKRSRRRASTEDSDEDIAQALSEEEIEPAPKKSKKITTAKTVKGKKANGIAEKDKSGRRATPANGTDADEEEAYNSFDEEAERVQAEVEAAAAWADVRRRKEAATSSSTASAKPPSKSSTEQPSSSSTPSLTAWLGKGPSASSSVAELASSLPMPTTCTAAQIVDRSSLFIGYVYPLTTASSAYISTLLSHLTRVVHPTVPKDHLPPQFANAPASKRGSSHDMYAYRIFELKRGRTGLAGRTTSRCTKRKKTMESDGAATVCSK